MYIKSIRISNVKCLSEVELDWAKGKEAGWHVLVGDNGIGKSTLLKAISLALLGPSASDLLRLEPRSWIKQGSQTASIRLTLLRDILNDQWGKRGPPPETLGLSLIIEENGIRSEKKNEQAEANVWNQKTSGWFSVAFGPFRRFSGGNQDLVKLFYSHPRLGRHLSLHGEDVALTEVVTWLRNLRHQELERESPQGDSVLDRIKHFVNTSLLPKEVRLTSVTADGVFFQSPSIDSIRMEDLSDGYRSVLSMSLEIIRQASSTFDMVDILSTNGSASLAGVALVDEIDVHLHPSWQALVGEQLRRAFPRIQFIVTTHSPLACQAADTIWRLEDSDGSVTVRPMLGMEFQTLRNGNVQEVYGLTSAFGSVRERSPEGQRMLQRKADAAYGSTDFARFVSDSEES